MKQSIGQNMLLHTSFFGEKVTFKLLPLTDDCPFTEVIYDPSTTMLVVMSKIKKQNYQFVAKLDDNGDIQKTNKTRANGKPYKEQRVLMELLQEHYITEPVEQEDFIRMFAVNAESFDYQKTLRHMDSEPTIHAVEKSGLVDGNGMPLKKENPIKPAKEKKKNKK